jgi:ATP-dependent Lon protease
MHVLRSNKCYISTNAPKKIKKEIIDDVVQKRFDPLAFSETITYSEMMDSSDESISEYHVVNESDNLILEPTINKNTMSSEEESISLEEGEIESDTEMQTILELFSLSKEDSSESSETSSGQGNQTLSFKKLAEAAILHKYPNFTKDQIEQAVSFIMKDFENFSIEKDKRGDIYPKWKEGLEKEEIDKIKVAWNELKNQEYNEIPSKARIILAPIDEREKMRILRLYQGLSITTLYSPEYYEICDRINFMLKRENPDVLPHYTLNDIENAKITEENKIKAKKYYFSSNYYSIYSEGWFDIQKEIKEIMDNQATSDSELQLLLEQEKAISSISNKNENKTIKTILLLDTDPSIKSTLYSLYKTMEIKESNDSSYVNCKEKLNWYLQLPYYKTKPIESPLTFFSNVSSLLDKKIYGMKEAKEKILQCLNDKIKNPSSNHILALKGSPGVGKTKLAKTISEATGLPFEKINLGGTLDSTIFKGSENVWSGSAPSLLLQLIARCGYNNPVILLDEVDKLGNSLRGLSVQHALLHILDPVQNTSFQDSYLNDFNHDISKVWFVLSMNDDAHLDPALKDRLHIVDIEEYTEHEKLEILTRYTLPDVLVEKGLQKDSIVLDKDASFWLIHTYCTKDSGMRELEKITRDMVSKISLWETITDEQRKTLSYTVPKFNTYPYHVTKDTVEKIIKKKVSNHVCTSMYS